MSGLKQYIWMEMKGIWGLGAWTVSDVWQSKHILRQINGKWKVRPSVVEEFSSCLGSLSRVAISRIKKGKWWQPAWEQREKIGTPGTLLTSPWRNCKGRHTSRSRSKSLVEMVGCQRSLTPFHYPCCAGTDTHISQWVLPWNFFLVEGHGAGQDGRFCNKKGPRRPIKRAANPNPKEEPSFSIPIPHSVQQRKQTGTFSRRRKFHKPKAKWPSFWRWMTQGGGGKKRYIGRN